MKRKLISMALSIGIMASTIAGINTVCAEDNISVELNGQKLQFEVQPQIIDDYTMVPMRTIFEALGYEVTWNQESRSITALRGQQTITMTIDSYEYSNFNLKEAATSNDPLLWVQNSTHELDITPTIINGNTLVPLRAVSEIAGCTVDWNGQMKTVHITGKAYSKLDILNEYLINYGKYNDDAYTVTYSYGSYLIYIMYYPSPSDNMTIIRIMEPLDEPIMGHWYTNATAICLSNNPIYCAYGTVGGERIQEIIPSDFQTSISKGIYRTYPAKSNNSSTEYYYNVAEKSIAGYCNIAFNMFNMCMAENYMNLSASDFGIVLDN